MFLDKLIGMFSQDIAIDLGTANTVVSVKGKGIIINEPSVVAVQYDGYGRKRILAVGKEAKEMVGKTPGSIQAIRPMRDGVIADFEMTERMIRYFIVKAHERKTFIRPRVIICVPYGITQVEKKAVKESAMSAGAREVFLIEEPMAAAIGAGLPIKQPQGNLIVDIGGGTTEIGVTSLGGLVISKSIKIAGDRIDAAIISYVRHEYSLQIGDRTAEEIKMLAGTAVPLKEDIVIPVKGKDNIAGLLKTIELTSEDIRKAMQDPLNELARSLKEILEIMPPDLAGDIVENGIVLSGGGALIRGLDKFFSEAVKLPVYVADEPLLAVARGTAAALEQLDMLKNLDNDY